MQCDDAEIFVSRSKISSSSPKQLQFRSSITVFDSADILRVN